MQVKRNTVEIRESANGRKQMRTKGRKKRKGKDGEEDEEEEEVAKVTPAYPSLNLWRNETKARLLSYASLVLLTSR